MLVTEGILVGLAVAVINFLEPMLSFPMLNRPMVVGPVIGFLLGDLTSGVLMGASLELVFMGVVGIGGTTPPDALLGSAVGTAFAIIMNADVEVALALAVPVALLGSMANPLFFMARSLFHPLIEKMIDRGDYKGLERMVPLSTLTLIVPKGIIVALAVMMGSNAIQGVIDVIPAFVTGGLSVAGGMMAAVGFALLLKMMWSKTMCVYFFLGFVAAAYLNLPIMAIAFFGIILSVILFFEGSFRKQTNTAAAQQEEEELFND